MVQVTVGSPLAEALQNAVLPKLQEAGWSSGGQDDTALAEYVILMLVNGKGKTEIAHELSNDLLGLGPDDPGAAQFAEWLFEQAGALDAQLNGSAPVSAPAAEAQFAVAEEIMAEQQDQQQDQNDQAPQADGADADMGDAVPTGPKSMRNGAQKGRDKRMLGQLNRNLTGAGDAALHRVRGANGAGRINAHGNRDAPKGPRGQQINRAMQMANGRQVGGPMGMPPGPMGFPQQQQMMGGMHNGPLNPQQQMQLLAMMEQQSQMMAQLMTGGPPGFGPNGPGPGAKSLFARVEDRPNRRNNRPHNKPQQSGNAETNADISMDLETGSATADPANTLCRFNLSCTRPDCNFAHQSSAAPPGVNVDMNDACTFGAACKNFKCTAKHPSPAKKFAHQAEIQCSFWPSCTKPNCPFKHPAPLCRNGGDCQVPDCKFTHNTTMCKFNPCKNPKCMFKHAEGQKGVFGDKVWTADGADHVSERKFVDNEGAEELILPGSNSQDQSGGADIPIKEDLQQPEITA